ncbi:Type II/IV secretion system protein TadC, associated with Flp pilus assembly [Candidatus Syntrophocurvum alkaliphilum]|uniref:Type II/IV secretion system protein TadC, associated with Flp pilus assembly n=1 Tax=Candidatus Syntrophocurvum alkaliphilum TaxID=2293317 RepID=A0A6I6DG72_9FIRM|nr:type II secretion system F family protein [Candidatus Syntrophocurvum alkaliphilum]QGU00107.1 Type II/IV secretion system protein TadC, associated with Flp pilus assembly [Candidatus Syntrophocurvum alkaliphilum]
MQALILILVTIMVSSIVIGILYHVNYKKIITMDRLKSYVEEDADQFFPPELNQPLKDRMFKPIAESITNVFKNFIPQEKKLIYEKQLMHAGYPNGLTVEGFIAFKFISVVIALLIGVIIGGIFAIALLLLIGIYLPSMYLRSKEKERKKEILKSLPDNLDLLSVSVEAGLGFDGAMQKVVEKTSGPLKKEFEKVLQEINIGKPRREALRDMANRVEVDDVSTFIGSIIQADQLGVSIGNVLKLQADQVRNNRRMRAEEAAQKAPIKILIPLVLFIFPTILIVLLGPAVIQLIETL